MKCTVPLQSTLKEENEIALKGMTICPGIGFGKAQILDRVISVAKITITLDQIKKEQERYAYAVRVVGSRLGQHINEAHNGSWLSASQILKVHRAILEDETIHKSVRRRISSELKNAEWAVLDEAEAIISGLEATRNPYFQARAEDIRDLATNIIEVLTLPVDSYRESFKCPQESYVIITGNLYPSSVGQARHLCASGFATESSIISSHAAILLKGFGIPAIGKVKGLRGNAQNGDKVIVDAFDGLIIIRPQAATLKKYMTFKQQLEVPMEIPPPPPKATYSKNGTRVSLMANIENQNQVEMMLRNRLEGIGLLRTEYIALNALSMPGEEEQYAIYRKVINAAAGRRVVIRTFDIGVDKQNPRLYRNKDLNPALGVRGIRRHLLRCPEELRVQLRAILRASCDAPVAILIPMVTTVEEIKKVKEHLKITREELRLEAKPFSSEVTLGAMIEIPAAAIAVSSILEEVDFVSVGTNDLLQYFMAVDRDNEELLEYGDYDNEAFLYLLQFVIERAAEMGRETDVIICGEMASHPHLIPRLLQLGFRTFSISPISAQSVREAVADVDISLSANWKGQLLPGDGIKKFS